ncbi:hypothetical protein GGI07_000720 [Coemansia sp. Benny D115]|nr:hypothetical protein GGI07_000720 [Coemansia sp. Benny D115]
MCGSIIYQSLNIYHIVSRFGWVSLFPFVFTLCHSFLLHYVNRLITISKRHTIQGTQPEFQSQFSNITRYMRAIKLYGLESVFIEGYRRVSARLTAPLYLRASKVFLDIINIIDTPLVALIVFYWTNAPDSTIAYSELAVITHIISSLIAFTKTTSRMSEPLETIIDLQLVFTKLFKAHETKFATRKPENESKTAAVVLNDCKFEWYNVTSKLKPATLTVHKGEFVTVVDIYVLDDILSAVDAHVERHIIDNLFGENGILKTKTCILVTHAMHVVPLSDRMIRVEDGAITVDQQKRIEFNRKQSSTVDEKVPDTPVPIGKSDAGKFNIAPELDVPAFDRSMIFKYLRLSGYGTVALVMLLQCLCAYLLHYVEVKRVIRFKTLVNDLSMEVLRVFVFIYALWRRARKSDQMGPGDVDTMLSLIIEAYKAVPALRFENPNLPFVLPSLARIFTYMEKLEKEAPHVIESTQPPSSWPQRGEITFKDYSMRYRKELSLAVNDISFSVRGREKIGIVGRTGAGKSSLMYAMTRIVEPESGSIFIDGVDISTIGLNTLRSQISVVPQDPVLFEGTIRDNLDPKKEHTDEQIWEAIGKAKIEYLMETPAAEYDPEKHNLNKDIGTCVGPWIARTGLEKWVLPEGKNFSVGQRQLISLCRAILWRRPILILDEATANIDTLTDKIMQTVVRSEFKNHTVLTIAHRLNTIMDSDRILVVSNAKVVEFDTPKNLLARKDSQLSELVESMKINEKRIMLE